MIEFNLLPDIKQEFVRINRTKRLVIIVSVLLSAVVLLVFLLLITWDGLQKKNLNDINSDISTNKATLTSTPSLNQILTIQNQLNSLPALYQQNPVTSRMFGYLSQITPDKATISSLSIDFQQHTVTITGNADSLATINVFADTLKFTTYTLPGQSSTATPAFSDVVLTSFSLTNSGASYTFTFSFDPTLFNSSNKLTTLTVPPETTTRSVLDQPDLFQKSGSTTNGNQ